MLMLRYVRRDYLLMNEIRDSLQSELAIRYLMAPHWDNATGYVCLEGRSRELYKLFSFKSVYEVEIFPSIRVSDPPH